MISRTVSQIDASRERLRQVVSGASNGPLSRTDENGWNIAALFAHIAFWDRRAAWLIRRARAGDCSSAPADLDAINAAALPQWRLIQPRAAGLEAIDAAEDIDRLVKGLSPELREILRSCRITFDRSEHRNAHLDQIEELLSAG